MLAIRLNRVGKKNKAQFRIVLQEHTVAPGGRHVEILGSWDPHQKKGVFEGEKINYWISKGAQASDSVWNILIKQGIVKGKKRAIKIKKTGKAQKKIEMTQKTQKETKETKKEETKTEEVKTETPKKEEIKKEEKIEEKKPEEAKPEEKK